VSATASAHGGRPVDRLTLADVERVTAVNYLSPVAITLALLPRLLGRGSGTVVNVTSLGGRIPILHEAAYCGSKFALTGWTEALATDLAGTGLAVRLVLPGPVDTEIWDQPDNDPADYSGPLVPAEEVAAAIVASIDSPRFDHYVPDLSAVVDMKTQDFDGFVAAVRAMADPGPRGPR
jgi:short-subunit dehydrogenase